MAALEAKPVDSADIRVQIDSVRVSKTNSLQVVVLVDDKTEMYLPIWVGATYGNIIVSELRHLPHQDCTVLVEHVLVQGKPTKMCITDLVDDVYYAVVTLDNGEAVIDLPMKPNDAICIAVRLELPMFVKQSVMQAAGRTKPSGNVVVRALPVLDRIFAKPVKKR